MAADLLFTNFNTINTELKHANRRKIILEKHPEIKQLFGYDPLFKWVVTGMVVTQLAMLPLVQHLSWPLVLLLAYCFGGVINHSLMLALHEIAHNFSFGQNRPLLNRLFGLFANLPVGAPLFSSFRNYHMQHHKNQSNEILDNYHVTLVEAKLFKSKLGKLFWLSFQPLFYTLRPLVDKPKLPTPLEITNLVVQLFFNAVIIKFYGWKALGYLVFGSLMSTSLHPVSAHFIAAHYMPREGFETYSYYGPLNWVTFNVGYHNEHHDFPAVPCSRLPQIKKIAPEFYEDLPQHRSWPAVIYHFVMDPNIELYAKIKRIHLGLSY